MEKLGEKWDSVKSQRTSAHGIRVHTAVMDVARRVCLETGGCRAAKRAKPEALTS